MKKSNTLLLAVIILAIVTAFILGVKLAPQFEHSTPEHSKQEQANQQSPTNRYTCPMHSHINQTNQGECPICGMDLVAKQSAKPSTEQGPQQNNEQNKERTTEQGEVYINAATLNNFAIKTAPAIIGTINKPITIYGYINQINAAKPQPIKTNIKGVLTELGRNKLSNSTQHYAEGETIYTLESKDYVQTQQNYIDAVTANNVARMRQSAHQLRKMGFDQQSLKQIGQNKQPHRYYHFKAPAAGQLDNTQVKIGQTLEPNTVIGTYIPRYPISAYAKVFETQWIWLEAGQSVSLKIRSYPGKTWQGVVKSVEDLAQSSTTAVKVFADFETNDQVDLRLGMQAELTVATATTKQALLVPNAAVIQTGSKSVVVVAKGDGYFQPVAVEVGLSNQAQTQILSGLEQGMNVVVSGQFLLDAQSEINAGLNRLSSDEAQP